MLPPNTSDQPAESRVAEPLGQLQHGQPAFCAQRLLRDPPPLVFGSDQIGLRDRDIVEEDLAEMGLAGRVPDRPNVDARRTHVHQKVRDTVSLRRGRVRPGQQQAPVGVGGAARPQFLSVDDEVVSVRRAVVRAGQIRSRLRLGEALNPDLAVEDGGQVTSALLVGARGEEGGGGMVNGDERQHQPRGVVGGQLLVEHDLLGRATSRLPIRAANAARRNRPGVAPGTTLSGTRRIPHPARRSARRQPAGTCARHQSRTGARNSPSSTAAEVIRRLPRLRRRFARSASNRARCSSDCMVAPSATNPACTAPLRARERYMFSTRLVP